MAEEEDIDFDVLMQPELLLQQGEVDGDDIAGHIQHAHNVVRLPLALESHAHAIVDRHLPEDGPGNVGHRKMSTPILRETSLNLSARCFSMSSSIWL